MFLGYNTNGFYHHDLTQALEVMSSLGYRGVALTLDHGVLNPFGAEFDTALDSISAVLEDLGLRSVIETGARYLLDPWQKHEPTLVSPEKADRNRRVEFLRRAVHAARRLDSDCVSLWSGPVVDNAPDEQVWARLVDGLSQVLDFANEADVCLAFEPEPGMFVDSMARFAELDRQLDAPTLALTLDLGHLHCQREFPIPDQIRAWSARLVNVHVEDMKAGVHEHLMFGEGEMEFPPILQTLSEVGYERGVYVELSRHGHVAVEAARKAMKFLGPYFASKG
jgi:sugar phosphate isomerase/epimerase